MRSTSSSSFLPATGRRPIHSVVVNGAECEPYISKDTTVWGASPDETVLEAIRRMAEQNVGALLVLEDDQLVGFVS